GVLIRTVPVIEPVLWLQLALLQGDKDQGFIEVIFAVGPAHAGGKNKEDAKETGKDTPLTVRHVPIVSRDKAERDRYRNDKSKLSLRHMPRTQALGDAPFTACATPSPCIS